MTHPVDQYVGKKLRMRRTILGMSQEAVGKAIGVTFQQVQKYERGVNRIGASRLYDFSRLLKVPVGYFYSGYAAEGQQPSESDEPFGYAQGMAEENAAFESEALSSRETLEMMRAYYRIKDPMVRKKVSDLIKSMASEEVAQEAKTVEPV